MSKADQVKVTIQSYAILKEQRGKSEEEMETSACTPHELYQQIQSQYHLRISEKLLKVAVNDEFCGWDTSLKQGDRVIFIPPVAGG